MMPGHTKSAEASSLRGPAVQGWIGWARARAHPGSIGRLRGWAHRLAAARIAGAGLAALSGLSAVALVTTLSAAGVAAKGAPPAHGTTIYVTNASHSSVTGYAIGASSPAVTIAGPTTQLASPSGVAFDPAGDLFVASFALGGAHPKVIDVAAKVVVSPPAKVVNGAAGSGTTTGTSQAKGHFAHFPPPCALTLSLSFEGTGSGTYHASESGRSATYIGPITQTLAKTAQPGYTGPLGTHGYSPTCSNPAGTPWHAVATTQGSHGLSSVRCTYTGSLSRVNPRLGNGTDIARAVLTGKCTVRQGAVVVNNAATLEVRIMNYILDSCTGGPAPNFACHVRTAFNASSLP